ncbi:acetyl-CoA carboxylase carboxyltransferase subunit beta [bacterium]|nr:acetyl-CoA carboxylase carboxyltransferase subunit beta [bacterium]
MTNSFSRLRKKRRCIPDGLWTKCEGCGEIIYNKKLREALQVCPKCSYHYKLAIRDRIAMLTDEDSFTEIDVNLVSADPLEFNDGTPYPEKHESARAKTGENEAVVYGLGKTDGREIVLAVMNFDFMGGSVGSAVGEKITRAAELALEKKIPFVIVTASGGVRMHEGIVGLMQMAKTAAAIGRLKNAGVPYIVILTNPTYGGTTASFATLGDIIIAEPKAMIGFAGARVIKQTTHQDLPEGFQTAEFLLQHGQIDIISPRPELKETLSKCLGYLCSQES